MQELVYEISVGIPVGVGAKGSVSERAGAGVCLSIGVPVGACMELFLIFILLVIVVAYDSVLLLFQ